MKTRMVRPSDPPPTYALHQRAKARRAKRLIENRRHKGR